MKTTSTKKRKNVSMNREERIKEGTKIWASFYRENLHRFADDFLDGINLFTFQKMWLYYLNKSLTSCFICSRGLSKSYTLAVFMCLKCILYPGTKVVISCETKETSKRIISEKIQGELMAKSSNLRREIKECKVGINESHVIFKNGSKITSINASNNTRGMRATMLIVDEYIQIKGGYDTITKILQPFLNVQRQPRFLTTGKYGKEFIEENQEIYLSSAGYTNTWYYDLYEEVVSNMLEGKEAFACNLPYTLANHHGLLSDARVKKIREDKNMTDMAFETEYNAQFWSINDKAFFMPNDILSNRNIVKPWYPPTEVQYLEEKDKRNKSWSLPRDTNEELRVLSCDIATSSSSSTVYNDASIYTFIKANPKGEKYISEVLYSESLEGWKIEEQVLRIKRLWYDGDVDYIVLDVRNAGIAILDLLANYTYDEQRDIKYPPFKSMNNKEHADRCSYREAKEIVYSIVGTEQLNSEIAFTFKSSLENHTTQFLINEIEAEDYLVEHKNFNLQPNERKVELMLPYLQTTLMQNEILELEADTSGKYLKLREKSSMRKDRYSSVSYGIYFIKQREQKLKKKTKKKFFSAW